MFALDALFKYKMSKLEDRKFKLEDVDSNPGLRCLFVTASPVLTHEIRKYYNNLT
jgi:hypothetical protein